MLVGRTLLVYLLTYVGLGVVGLALPGRLQLIEELELSDTGRRLLGQAGSQSRGAPANGTGCVRC